MDFNTYFLVLQRSAYILRMLMAENFKDFLGGGGNVVQEESEWGLGLTFNKHQYIDSKYIPALHFPNIKEQAVLYK